MSRMIPVALSAALVSLTASATLAQVKTIPGEHMTTTVTVVSVEQASRSLTFKDAKGELRTVTVPETVTRFPQIKPGDTITVTYYDNITLRKKDPGESDADTLTGGVTGTSGTKPGGTLAAQRRITATVADIDMGVPSITFTGPSDWKYSTKVQDKKALEQVKVGDRVEITWTEAILVSVAPPKP